MKKWQIRAWPVDVLCGGANVRVHFVLPDTFFDVTLFACAACSAIIGVDRERERYSGKKFEDLRKSLRCPNCNESLTTAMEYPQTFQCPDGTLGHFDLPSDYPPDTDLVELEVWDPYG
jgi:rubredoxin